MRNLPRKDSMYAVCICQRCGHLWIADSFNPPQACANTSCRSLRWQKPRLPGAARTADKATAKARELMERRLVNYFLPVLIDALKAAAIAPVDSATDPALVDGAD